MVKENLYNVIKCFSNKALKYRANTHLCNTSSLVTVVETAIWVNYGHEAALIPGEVILERMMWEVHNEEGACHLHKPDLSGNLVYVEHNMIKLDV